MEDKEKIKQKKEIIAKKITRLKRGIKEKDLDIEWLKRDLKAALTMFDYFYKPTKIILEDALIYTIKAV